MELVLEENKKRNQMKSVKKRISEKGRRIVKMGREMKEKAPTVNVMKSPTTKVRVRMESQIRTVKIKIQGIPAPLNLVEGQDLYKMGQPQKLTKAESRSHLELRSFGVRA